MSKINYRSLRPYLHNALRVSTKHDRAGVYYAFQRRFAQSSAKAGPDATLSASSHDHYKRLQQLQAAGDLASFYPENPRRRDRTTPQRLHAEYAGLEKDEIRRDVTVSVSGRVMTRRLAGSKLAFVHFEDRHVSIQALCNFSELEKHGVERDSFRQFFKCVRKGDIVSVVGHPSRSSAGELSITAIEVPQFLAPSLHQIPEELRYDSEIVAKQPHVDFLVDKRRAAIQRIRSRILGTMRDFFDEDDFLEVNTPILTAGAGGAIARPFETSATEFSDESLTLRIAPELFLKRLVVGTGERLYEIGSVFRNEGIDATHNPEFQICEFYEPYANLEDLIHRTETLFSRLSSAVAHLVQEKAGLLFDTIPTFQGPFARLEFIPTIERAINRKLPPLHSSTATADISNLFKDLAIPLPSNPTLPRMLDALAGRYIEPLCTAPTFITHHPEIMSPLAKSFTDPASGQILSRRVELFIEGREYVNAYEEENSPFEQRRKFEAQLEHKGTGGESMGGDGAKGGIDESYVEALEWGLPPTGGWGCGIDRLVMLFSGAERIAEVQPFGTLRNVVALAKGKRS